MYNLSVKTQHTVEISPVDPNHLVCDLREALSAQTLSGIAAGYKKEKLPTTQLPFILLATLWLRVSLGWRCFFYFWAIYIKGCSQWSPCRSRRASILSLLSLQRTNSANTTTVLSTEAHYCQAKIRKTDDSLYVIKIQILMVSLNFSQLWDMSTFWLL